MSQRANILMRWCFPASRVASRPCCLWKQRIYDTGGEVACLLEMPQDTWLWCKGCRIDPSGVLDLSSLLCVRFKPLHGCLLGCHIGEKVSTNIGKCLTLHQTIGPSRTILSTQGLIQVFFLLWSSIWDLFTWVAKDWIWGCLPAK